ncbi:Polyprotein [Phytophthora palmivora]|uniref:Polyprotein n=1 Tax=Phytophthora palmivora TaxID=4796 RepID=A0A2P4YU21_9STRA|nr:Polyprotein [Phytophthora palmivora]
MTCTRPDIPYVEAQLSRFLEKPSLQHWRAAIRILRYLKTTREHGIMYHMERSGGVQAHIPEDGLRSAPLKQSILVACDAEGYGQTATERYADLGAIALANNAGYNSRMKHVDINHHFTRETVERGTVKVDYVDTKHQLADLLTKGLSTKALKYLNNASGIKAKITMQ